VFEYFERSGLELVLAHHPLPDPFQSAHHCYLLIEGETPTAEEEERFQNTLMEVLEEGMIDDAVVAQSSKQAGELFALRELIAEVANIHHSPHKNDISVPVRALPPFLNELRALYQERFPEYRSVIFGHVGDGNLHINVLKPEGVEKDAFFAECHALDEAIFSVVERYQGSISAEHGVGLLKKPYLHYSRTSAEIELMRQIKRAFDPENLFNPGKIFSCD
jgi:FAD/FMN-containing dehydrogenase